MGNKSTWRLNRKSLKVVRKERSHRALLAKYKRLLAEECPRQKISQKWIDIVRKSEYNKTNAVRSKRVHCKKSAVLDIKSTQTPAERQKRYRERLKQTDPEKFLLQKRKNLERTNAKRKKISEYQWSEQEMIRKEWRERKKKYKEQSSREQCCRESERKCKEESSLPSSSVLQMSREQGEESLPGPSGETTLPGTLQRSDPDIMDFHEEEPQDPLKKDTPQCRCCGDFTEDCIDVTEEKPYLSSNRTTRLALNGLCVDLDFKHTLPKTICRDCDGKLQEIHIFINRVHTAQQTMINFDDVDEAKMFKIETDFPSDNEDIDNDETEHGVEVAGVLQINEAVSVKKAVSHKRARERDAEITKVKKKPKDKACDNNITMITIKEEFNHEEEAHIEYYEVSDLGTCIKSSEFKVTEILSSEMAGDDTLS